ncbi:MAG: Gfo/Idh/MocA family protein [Pirellulaceae bacterium]
MTNSARKLGVAIHGVGDVAYAHAASWCRSPHAEIVSISSRNPESAQRLADKFGLRCTIHRNYEEVLQDPRVDIVNLSGPSYVHAEQAIAAAESGRHVLVEKPMVLTMDENRALRDAVAKSHVKTVVGFVLRWNPMFQSLKTLLAQRTIGDLFYAEVDYWHGLGPSYRGWDWASRRSTGGSAMLFGGCHAVDALRWFANEEVLEVSALANNQRALWEYDANVVAIVKFRSGAIGKTSVLFDAKIPYTFNVDLLGTDGSVRDNRLWIPKLLPGQRQWSTFPTITPESADVHHHPFDAQIDHFVDCIRHDVESHCNVADSYHTHELCLAIDQSVSEGGRLIRLPLTRP